MAGPEVIGALRDLCGSVLQRRGLELVELVFAGERGARVLRVSVDRADPPVDLEELTKVSGELSRALDLEDPIEGRYTLEVSSAGLERPLVRPADYTRFAGREIKVRCEEPIAGRRNFQGVLSSSDESGFVLKSGEEEFEIPYDRVARTRLVVDWDKELKGGAR